MNDHVCQPRPGGFPCPEFPGAYMHNPWCWTPELGFHRARDPGTEVTLSPCRRGGRAVGKNYVSMGQAVRLGIGIGTSFWGGGDQEHGWGEMFSRILEVVDHGPWPRDPAVYANFGYKIRRLVDDGSYKALQGWPRETGEELVRAGALRREWFRASYLAIGDTSPLGSWKAPLDRAAAGQATRSDLRRAKAPRAAATPRMPAAWLDYVCPHVLNNMTLDAPHHGGMRSHSRAAALCLQTAGEREQWMFDTLAAAREATTEGVADVSGCR